MLQVALRRKIPLVCFSVFLTACGGGGGSDTQAPGGTSNDRFASAGCGIFCASVLSAPPDGAAVSGFVRLELTANNIKNVELLPETGYTPKYGRFNLSPIDATRSNAWMDLDTTKLPNGPLKVRIAMFDAPAGQAGSEGTAITRTLNINNPVAPGSLSVASVSAPPNGTVMSGTRKLEVRGTGLSNVELLPATGYAPKLGVFNVSPDRTYAWLDLDTKTQSDGLKNVRISAFSNTAGQPDAREVVAMPARQWNFQNGLGAFNANTFVAPIYSDIIGPYLHVEVRGVGLENVELLPATGYTPKFGTATISADKTKANILVDVSTLPKNPSSNLSTFRVSAFNKPAGDPTAQEIVVMPPRQFDIRSGSSTPPSDPTAPAFTAQLVAAPPTGRFLGEQENTYSDTVYFEVSGTELRNVELVSANNTSIKYGTFTISADGTRATLNWDYQLGDENGAYAAYDLRVLAWNVSAGQAGESVEVMAPRRYFRRVSPGMCAVSGCVGAP